VLPNVLIGGAQKSGTTTLHHFLGSHPESFTPRDRQEIHYVDVEASRGRDLDWYRSLFSGWAGEPVVFQTSPLYLFLPVVPDRVQRVIPGARIVFVLRDPVNRAYSHYWHEIRFGRETLPFEAALAAEPERIDRGFEYLRAYSYEARGHYLPQLKRYCDRFRRDRMLVLRTEDLSGDLTGLARRLGAFLGLDPGPWLDGTRDRVVPVFNRRKIPRSRILQRMMLPFRQGLPGLVWLVEKLNLRSSDYPAMARETREMLRARFLPELPELEELIESDLSQWREGP
jgi:hypothetical protein